VKYAFVSDPDTWVQLLQLLPLLFDEIFADFDYMIARALIDFWVFLLQ
jgi:hypothetical protein